MTPVGRPSDIATPTDKATGTRAGTRHVVVDEGTSNAHPLGGDVIGADERFVDQATVTLPSARRMPALGLGTWQLVGDECRRMVGAALDLGIRHLDTAQSYGNEADVAAASIATGVTTIPKTTDRDHLADNLAALTVELDQDDLDRIAALDDGRRLVDPDHAPW